LRRTSGMTGAATISNYVISFVRLFVFEICSSLVMSVPPLRGSSMKAISSGDGSRPVRLGSWAAVRHHAHWLEGQYDRLPALMAAVSGIHPCSQTVPIGDLSRCSNLREQNCGRGRDASYLAPPAQNRTCGFPAYGSHLGSKRQAVAVCVPAPVTRESGAESSACFAGPHFPWSPPLAPPAPLRLTPPRTAPQWGATLFAGFTATTAGSDFSCPCIIGYGSSPSRCGPSLSRDADGQTRDLPGSDTIPLHVMWPSTPAGRQHLAKRCRTCCLRANRNPRPLRYLIFRGSIPHPMQSLCTLRNHCRQWPRNTRYQADATPYLGRTFTGRIAPALPGAPIRSPHQRGRAAAAAP
jgi:hypothetical protein